MMSDQTRAGAASRPAPARPAPAPEPIPFPAPRQPARRVRTIDDELAAIANVLGAPVTLDDACTALRAARPDLAVLAHPETLTILRGRHLYGVAAVIRAHLLGASGLPRLTCPEDGCTWTTNPFPGPDVPDWAAIAASCHDFYAHGPGREHLQRRQVGRAYTLPDAAAVAGLLIPYLLLLALLVLAWVGVDLLGARLGWWS